jgi:hypothetical protein
MAANRLDGTNGRTMIRLLVTLLLAVPTGGCVSRMINERDDAFCQSKGTNPGSQPYLQCRLQKAVH